MRRFRAQRLIAIGLIGLMAAIAVMGYVSVRRGVQNLRIISQDVIHALYLPALRLQVAALPDRYTDLWFTADRPGTYHLFCSEYCGTDHSVMGGMLTATVLAVIFVPVFFVFVLGLFSRARGRAAGPQPAE